MKPTETPTSSALFKTDNTAITFARQADGTIRMTRLGWDEAKILLVGEALEVRMLDGHIAGFRQAKGGPVDYRALLKAYMRGVRRP
jgi:hypothetical protein